MSEKILMFKCCHLITKMEEEGISNVYIDHSMNKISSSFRGTFSIDNIPTFNDESFSLIVNLSKENEKGSHFIAISSSKNKIVYFDSFGIPNKILSLEKYLEKYKKKRLFIQNINYKMNSVLTVDSFAFHLFCVSKKTFPYINF